LLQLASGGAEGGTAATDGLSTDSATTQTAVKALQMQLVFPGAQSRGQLNARIYPPAGCELVILDGPDGTKIVGLLGSPIAKAGTHPPPSLLYFYGNGMCMADSLSEFNQFRRLGFNVIVVDYEGYGMSGGEPSEQGCYAAADAAYDYLLTRNDVDKERIVAVGWSLGAAVAIDLASRKHVAGLATFSAFTNISDMGRVLSPGHVEIDLGCQFDNLAKIGSVSCPIFMAHGTADQLVPPEMLDRLAKAAKSKVTIARVSGAGHNDIFQQGGDSLYQQVGAFVSALPPRQPTTEPR
jgi:pimeloyl-ACP methyl ester carboxylesterase